MRESLAEKRRLNRMFLKSPQMLVAVLGVRKQVPALVYD
jgi:hypothetical protein